MDRFAGQLMIGLLVGLCLTGCQSFQQRKEVRAESTLLGTLEVDGLAVLPQQIDVPAGGISLGHVVGKALHYESLDYLQDIQGLDDLNVVLTRGNEQVVFPMRMALYEDAAHVDLQPGDLVSVRSWSTSELLTRNVDVNQPRAILTSGIIQNPGPHALTQDSSTLGDLIGAELVGDNTRGQLRATVVSIVPSTTRGIKRRLYLPIDDNDYESEVLDSIRDAELASGDSISFSQLGLEPLIIRGRVARQERQKAALQRARQLTEVAAPKFPAIAKSAEQLKGNFGGLLDTIKGGLGFLN